MDWVTDPRIWAAIVIVVQFILIAAHWLGRKSFATTEDLLAVNKILQDQLDTAERENRDAHHKIELLEQKVKGLPDFEDIDKLRETVTKLDRSVATLASEVKNVDTNLERTSNSVDRIEQHLLRGKAA